MGSPALIFTARIMIYARDAAMIMKRQQYARAGHFDGGSSRMQNNTIADADTYYMKYK